MKRRSLDRCRFACMNASRLWRVDLNVVLTLTRNAMPWIRLKQKLIFKNNSFSFKVYYSHLQYVLADISLVIVVDKLKRN